MQVCSSQEVLTGLGGSASNYVCRVNGPWGFTDPRKFTLPPIVSDGAHISQLALTWQVCFSLWWGTGYSSEVLHTPGSLWVRLKDMMISLNMVLIFIRVLIREVLNHLGWHLEESVVALFYHVVLLPASALMASSINALMGWLWLLTSS
jgi:hypothetical protein